MGENRRKIRADFRKNREPRTRERDWTSHAGGDEHEQDAVVREERVSGKGELTRKRTVFGATADAEHSGYGVLRDVDEASCLRGRVLSVQGLLVTVEAEDGAIHKCATRRILKTLSTTQRHVVAAGDRVLFRAMQGGEGAIERVEPRTSVLARAVRGRQQVMVTNVDQMLIVTSAAEPNLKPNLIDRFLVAAHKGGLRPVICINKIDLVEPAGLQPLVGVYAQMGYPVLLVSASTGAGVERLRRAMSGKASVIAGQSGVGKSSLLNAVDPTLELRVREVSAETQKGKHTTTNARLLPLTFGGYVVDTPGIRQFVLWDVIPAEVAGYFRDLRPYIHLCRYPDCTHTHETDCAVKNAVADGRLDERRYDSYCNLLSGDMN